MRQTKHGVVHPRESSTERHERALLQLMECLSVFEHSDAHEDRALPLLQVNSENATEDDVRQVLALADDIRRDWQQRKGARTAPIAWGETLAALEWCIDGDEWLAAHVDLRSLRATCTPDRATWDHVRIASEVLERVMRHIEMRRADDAG